MKQLVGNGALGRVIPCTRRSMRRLRGARGAGDRTCMRLTCKTRQGWNEKRNPGALPLLSGMVLAGFCGSRHTIKPSPSPTGWSFAPAEGRGSVVSGIHRLARGRQPGRDGLRIRARRVGGARRCVVRPRCDELDGPGGADELEDSPGFAVVCGRGVAGRGAAARQQVAGPRTECRIRTTNVPRGTIGARPVTSEAAVPVTGTLSGR